MLRHGPDVDPVEAGQAVGGRVEMGDAGKVASHAALFVGPQHEQPIMPIAEFIEEAGVAVIHEMRDEGDDEMAG